MIAILCVCIKNLNIFGINGINLILSLPKETLVFLSVGEEKGPGLFLLAGPSDLVSEMGPR